MDTLFSLGAVALMLGVRHGFDVDHIVAIDNVTRKLVGEGRHSPGVGFFFALGHSTVVLLLCLLVGAGLHGLGDALREGNSELHWLAGLVGPLVSGSFLLLTGLLNLRLAVRRSPSGPCGPLSRVFQRATGAVRSSWQMYPLGFLFGLGFDTATEVSLLVLAAGVGVAGLSLWMTVALPLAFAAGMTLVDTVDGILMARAYGWAVSRPGGGVSYNLALTGLSATLAIAVGAAELVAALTAQTA